MKKNLMYLPGLLAQTGVYTLADLRADGRYGGQPVAEFGSQNALAVVIALTAQYNAASTASIALLADSTTERTESAPSGGGLRMERVGEFGNARTQRGGTNVGRAFPLYAFDAATGWTEHFEAITSVGAMIGMVEAVQQANDTALREAIVAALYNPLERPLEEDLILDDRIRTDVTTEVKVKPLYNGLDGELPEPGPSASFTTAHNHYLGSNGLSNEAVDALARTVGEHSTGNRVVIFINESDVSQFVGLPGFVPATISGVVLGANQASTNIVLDNSRTDYRDIGYTRGGNLVRTRPWALTGYAVAYNLNGPKALKIRRPKQAVFNGLRLRGQEGNTVLKARTWENLFGVGVSNRGGAAVLNYGPKPGGAPADVYAVPASLIQD